MSLLQMSFSGSVMIGVVIVIRALAVNRLPKRTFLILWGVVLLRLLVPYSIPSMLSVYSLVEQNIASDRLVLIPPAQSFHTESVDGVDADNLNVLEVEHNGETGNKTNAAPFSDTGEIIVAMQEINGKAEDALHSNDHEVDSRIINERESRLEYKNDSSVILDASYDANRENDICVIFPRVMQNIFVHYPWLKSLCVMIWCVGMILCIGYFAVSYLRCRSEFQISFPVENAFVQGWLQDNPRCRAISIFPVKNAFVQKWIEEHPRRPVSVRQSDRISTPLTYGIFHPVILMPKSTDWENAEQLQYILMHEYVHIRRHDALTKLIVICALCIHWFNPMVWIMWLLFNRDVEISCDESVVRYMGESSKSAYALMLIQMEAERSGFAPLCSGLLSKLGNKAMEERITAIMKIRKRSVPAVIAAAILVISVTAAFATSAAETKSKDAEKTDEKSTTTMLSTNFTEEEYEMLLALKLDGYEDMSISEYQNEVHSLTDTEEYDDLIERFYQDEAIYAMYETKSGTDSKETYDFLYNVLGPIMADQQSIGFSGSAVSDFSSASENATVEYTGTLMIMDADGLTVGEYISVRHGIQERMESILENLSVSELRDEELMKMLIDEEVKNITMTYQYHALQVAMEYAYRPPYNVAVDDMDDWQKARRDEWDRMMEPYVPFGLTYSYDWDTDDYKMFFNGKEVRGIYDEEASMWISEHAGIGKDIYDENATELFVVYEDHKIVGLREATAQEMEEITARRQTATDGNEEYQENPQYVREYAPATEEDYQSLFTLKTSDYRQKSIAEFDKEFLDWCNEDYERMERISCDRSWNDYRVVLTDEEISFVEYTTWLSGMENAEYVRSLQKNEPEHDISDRVRLTSKEEYAQNGYGSAWCSLDYSFSYHISDKEAVSIGERDDRIGRMVREIQDYWDSADINEILRLTKSDLLKQLQSIAAKYSNRNIAITILDDQTYFESMDERMLYDERE